MVRVVITRTYLELRSLDELRPKRFADPRAHIEHFRRCTPDEYRRLYRAVGEPWHWHERLAWSDEQLAAYLAGDAVSVFELRIGDQTAGYFELREGSDQATEIAYFGLVPAYIGRGLGGALLTSAVEEAFRRGAHRVWLHTCTLDSPHALPNYRARGFRELRTEQYEEDLPA